MNYENTNKERISRTLNSNPKVSRQAPIDVILQRHRERTIQGYAEEDEKEPLQGKFESVPASRQTPVAQLMRLTKRDYKMIVVNTLNDINGEFIPSIAYNGFTRPLQYNSIFSYLRDTGHADLLPDLNLANVDQAIKNSTMLLSFYGHSRRDVIQMIAEAYISKHTEEEVDAFQEDNPDAIKIGALGWKNKIDSGDVTIVNRAVSDLRQTGLTWPNADNITHWTRGGNGGGRTAFVAHVGESNYLIALGHHRSNNTYYIEWRASESGSFTGNEVTLG